MIMTSVQHRWPQSLIPEAMVSGFDLFQNSSFVVVTFSTALKLFTCGAKGTHVSAECNVEHAEGNVMDLRCIVILLQ